MCGPLTSMYKQCAILFYRYSWFTFTVGHCNHISTLSGVYPPQHTYKHAQLHLYYNNYYSKCTLGNTCSSVIFWQSAFDAVLIFCAVPTSNYQLEEMYRSADNNHQSWNSRSKKWKCLLRNIKLHFQL